MYVFDRNISEELKTRLNQLKSDGIQCVAFTGTGGWIIITKKNRRFARGIPEECFEQIKKYQANGHKIEWVSFSPNTLNSWSIITDRTFFNRNIGVCHQEMVRLGRSNIKKVIYHPIFKNRWIIIHKNGISSNGLPGLLKSKTVELEKSQSVHHISYDLIRNGWIILADQTYESFRIDKVLENQLRKFKNEQRKIDLVVINPEGSDSWIYSLDHVDSVSGLRNFRIERAGNVIRRTRTSATMQMPALLVISPDISSRAYINDSGLKCQKMLNEIEEYFREISMGAFSFRFNLRSAILTRSINWRGNAPARAIYRNNGLIQNLNQFPLEKDYTGFDPFVVWDREEGVSGQRNRVRNYVLKAYSNIVKSGMQSASTRQSWDSRISYEAWLKFGTHPTSNVAHINCIGLNDSANGKSAFVRRFGYNVATGDGTVNQSPRPVSNVTLMERVYSHFAWTWWRPDESYDKWTVAHEVGHILGLADHYRSRLSNGSRVGPPGGYLGTSSIMGNSGQWHLDGVNKMRLGWTEPQLIRRSDGVRSVNMYPVYKGLNSSLLIFPDDLNYSQEAFFLEVRDPAYMPQQNSKNEAELNGQYQGVMVYHIAGGSATRTRPVMDIIGESPIVRPGIDDPRGKKRAAHGAVPVQALRFYDGTDSRLRIHIGQKNGNGSWTVNITWV